MADPTTDSQAVTADATSATATPVDAPQTQAATDAAGATPAATTDANTADAANAGAAKASTDAANADVVYEFKLPEGVTIAPEVMEDLTVMSKELGLTPEQAQKVADLGAKQAQRFASQLQDQQKSITQEWADQTTNDKDIGGDKLPENLGVAKKALDTFGTPELKTLLNQSGLGNHPEIVRFMVKAGKAISEDGKLVTGNAAQADRANLPLADRLYPNQK